MAKSKEPEMTKKLFVINAIAFLLVCLALPFLLACDTGCEQHGDACACDERPVQDTTPEIKPSDEKPPRSGRPGWQDPSLHVDMPKSTLYEDSRRDEQKELSNLASPGQQKDVH